MKYGNIILFLAVLCSAVPAFANTDELVATMRRQQKESEATIVKLWNQDQRGEKMEKALSEYVIREVRLRSVTGTNKTGSLLGAVVKDGQTKFEHPQAMVQALVVEHYRRKGVDLDGNYFVSGTYMIQNADLKLEGD